MTLLEFVVEFVLVAIVYVLAHRSGYRSGQRDAHKAWGESLAASERSFRVLISPSEEDDR